jgi:hypothetical protein
VCIDCVLVGVSVCVRIYKFVWQKGSLVTANMALFYFNSWCNLSLKYLNSVEPVECIMKEMRRTMFKFYCNDRDSSYMFRLYKGAIIRLLISKV